MDSKELFKTVVTSVHPEMGQEALHYFVDGAVEKTLAKNEIFINDYAIHDEIGFIVQGLFRGFYVDDKGNEINTRFVKEMEFATHYKAFISQESSAYTFKAVEPSKLLCFNHQHIQKCYELFPSFQKFGRLMAEAIIKKMESRLESQHFDTAEKRYNDFMREYPDLHNRLSLEQISSYIRITRPALSRLRAKKP